MPTTETSRSSARILQVLTVRDHSVEQDAPQMMEQATLPVRLADPAVIEAPPLIQVYISSPSRFSAHGLLKSVSRAGLQILTPISVPLRSAVQVTIAGCRGARGEVVYCVRRSNVYHVGIVLTSHLRPELTVGGLATINALEEPFTITRGHVLDIGANALSILCKTMLVPSARVRVESNGWILFGEVESVVAISMAACCVGVRLEAVFRAGSALPAIDAPPIRSREFEGAVLGGTK